MVALIRLAVRNLFRQKFRTAMSLASVAFGVTGLILSGGFVNDIYIQLAEALIHSQSGHLQVARAEFFTAGARGSATPSLAQPHEVKRAIAQIADVDDVLARVQFSGLLNNGRSDWPVVGEGVEPEREARLGTHLRVIAGRRLEPGDRYGVLVGQGVAHALKVGVGDQLTLLANTAEGALNTTELDVVGVFQTFSRDFDARAIRVPLKVAQELLGSSDASVLVVSLRDTDATAATAALLRDAMSGRSLEVRTWLELNDYYEKTIALYERQFGVLRLIILIMVLLAVANSINMSAYERIGEFGTMRALGNRGSQVFRLLLVEAAMLGVLGGVIGVVLGVALALAISAIGIPMPPPPNANLGYTAFIRIVPSELLAAFAVAVLATTLAALLPAARMRRTPVVDALRENV